jgi:hypothetical protein
MTRIPSTRLAAAAMFLVVWSSTPLLALDVVTGSLGSNIQAVRNLATQNPNEIGLNRSLGWNLSGAGVNLGQIEPGRPGDPSLTDSVLAPLFGTSELNHSAINPGGPLVIGVAINGATGVGGTDHNNGLDDHATQVAGTMVAQNSGGSAWGSSPSSTLFSAAIVLPAAAPNGSWAQNVVANGEWLRSRPGGVRVVNHSYGLFVEDSLDSAGNNGSPNGLHLQTLYMDWSAVHHDVIHVIAGDENSWRNNANALPPPGPQRRRDVLGTDGYNSIVVGATQQRAAGGRFDEVSSFSNSIQTTDARGARVDLVAPGGASSQITLGTRNPATANGLPLIAPFRTVDVFPANNGPNERVSAVATLGTGYNPNMPTLLDNNMDGAFNQAGPAPMDTAGMATSRGTSFAAPQVSGMLGLMKQYGSANFGGLDHLTGKAALLNSASKHVLSKRADNNGDDLADVNGQSWPQRYEARYGAFPTSISQSRDPDMGFGQLNGLSAIKQIANGGVGSAVSIQSDSLAPGASSTGNLFVGGEKLAAGSLVTATIAWDRVVDTTMANPTLAQLQNPANYAVKNATNVPGGVSPIADLDIRLVNRSTGSTVAYVLSFKDNVEQLYFNVRETGDYDLVIDNRSNQAVKFGLAYSAGSSTGMAFTVDHNSQGRQMPAFQGNSGFPNDVNSLGHAGQGAFDVGGEIFSSALDGTNMQRVSGGLGTKSRVGPHLAVPSAQNLLDGSKGALGLQSGDQLAGLTWGHDGSWLNNERKNSVLTFSVDLASQGVPGTAVAAEAAFLSHSGDIFKSPVLDAFGVHASRRLDPAAANSNDLHIQESDLGLWAPSAGGSLLNNAQADNLRDFEHDNILDYTDTDGDGLLNNDAYFALSRNSPTVLAGGAAPGDILMAWAQDPSGTFDLNMPAGGAFYNVFAPAGAIGLIAGDAIDALVLSRQTPNVPHYIPVADEALFSLDPGSASVFGGLASPGDVYYTDFARPFLPNVPWNLGGSLFASAAQMGLMGNDNLDGLDIFSVPEPSALLLALLGVAGCLRMRRVRHA